MVKLRSAPALVRSAPARLRMPAKVADPFYQSREWIALREQRKRDPDYVAALARAKPGERVVLDHVVERKDGGAPLDPKNTRWLTHGEHQAKTAEAKRARAGRRGGGRKFPTPTPP